MAKQTKSYLMQKLREIGVEPASRHGQNFLIDLNLVKLIANSADLGPRDVVLEVGTGVGSLTALMAPAAGHVVTVEIDGNLFELASEELLTLGNVTMLRQDALKNKNRFAPEVMEAVGRALGQVEGARLKLVANLPYNVATPVISNLLLCEHTPHAMVCTIQKELADRLVAKPWSKDYGALSVWVQSQCTAEVVRVMPPKVFWPAPKV
ncbi:MAG: rRNA adenine dimethyltransferase family protein, partial [Planctomycetota bacterium]